MAAFSSLTAAPSVPRISPVSKQIAKVNPRFLPVFQRAPNARQTDDIELTIRGQLPG